MIRSLEALLTRFLKWGPNFLTLHADAQSISVAAALSSNESSVPKPQFYNIRVETLVLNFETPIPHEKFLTRVERGEIIHPVKAQGTASSYFSYLLGGGYRGDSAKSRDFIVPRLGGIRWEVDKELIYQHRIPLALLSAVIVASQHNFRNPNQTGRVLICYLTESSFSWNLQFHCSPSSSRQTANYYYEAFNQHYALI